jgi:hypothetical protein
VTASHDTAEVFYGTDGQIYYRIKALNGEEIAASEGYRHKADALDTLEQHFPSATVVDLTVDD